MRGEIPRRDQALPGTPRGKQMALLALRSCARRCKRSSIRWLRGLPAYALAGL